MTSSQHFYEVRARKDRRGVDLISDALPFGRLWLHWAGCGWQRNPDTPSIAADDIVL